MYNYKITIASNLHKNNKPNLSKTTKSILLLTTDIKMILFTLLNVQVAIVIIWPKGPICLYSSWDVLSLYERVNLSV